MEKKMETTIQGLLEGSIPSFLANQRKVEVQVQAGLAWCQTTIQFEQTQNRKWLNE